MVCVSPATRRPLNVNTSEFDVEFTLSCAPPELTATWSVYVLAPARPDRSARLLPPNLKTLAAAAPVPVPMLKRKLVPLADVSITLPPLSDAEISAARRAFAATLLPTAAVERALLMFWRATASLAPTATPP